MRAPWVSFPLRALIIYGVRYVLGCLAGWRLGVAAREAAQPPA